MLARSTMTLVMMAIFLTMLAIAWSYPPGSRFMVLVVGIPAVGLCLLQLAIDFFSSGDNRPSFSGEGGMVGEQEAELPRDVQIRREIAVWSFFLGFIALVLFFGFWIAIPILLFSFLWLQAGLRFLTSLATAVVSTPLLYLFFEKLLETQLHRGFLTPLFLEELEKIEALAPLIQLL